jgi:hypothetical protein
MTSFVERTINNAVIPTVVKLYVKDIFTGMFELRNLDVVTQINGGRIVCM